MTTTRPDVLVMYPTRPHAMSQLEAAYRLHRYDEAPDPEGYLAAHGPLCRGVVTNGHAALNETHLAHLPNVRIVACSSAGYEDIDVSALSARGIAFTNTSDALYDDVADVAVTLLLAARKRLVAAHHYVRSGEWGRRGMFPLLSALRGKRAGILGLGQIGRAIADRLEPFGFEIGYLARSPKPVGYRRFPSLRSMADWADALLVAVPGGAATRGIVDAEVLDALGPNGTLVNIARGSVVDEPALVAALREGRLGSAGLDVYWNEPNPDPALTALPNVTLFPHHASGTVETRDAMAQLVVDNLAAHFAGKPLLTPVNGA